LKNNPSKIGLFFVHLPEKQPVMTDNKSYFDMSLEERNIYWTTYCINLLEQYKKTSQKLADLNSRKENRKFKIITNDAIVVEYRKLLNEISETSMKNERLLKEIRFVFKNVRLTSFVDLSNPIEEKTAKSKSKKREKVNN